MARKITRKGIRNKLDKLVKLYVKERDGYVCQMCHKQLEDKNCHGSHVIPVSAGLRWAYDPENIIVLCFHDHLNFWHKNPIEAGDWFKKTFPKRYVYIMRKKAHYDYKTIKTLELVELYDSLKNKFERGDY